MSDDLCTGQGVVLGRARNRSAEACIDCRQNPLIKVEAQNRLTTFLPAKVLYLVEHGRNGSEEASLDHWRNPFSRVEAQNRLITYVSA